VKWREQPEPGSGQRPDYRLRRSSLCTGRTVPLRLCQSHGMPSRRDVEAELRRQLSRDAVIGEAQLRRGSVTTVDSVLDYLVSRAYGSPDRLLDVRDLLGQQDAGARALLLRASRRAADPVPPEPPRPFSPPAAPIP
jgi:hypothetical protein